MWMIYFLILSFISSKPIYIAKGNILSLVEHERKVGLITVLSDGKSVSLVTINSDMSSSSQLLQNFNNSVVYASAVDFDQNGVADLLVAVESGDLLEYSVLWDLEGSPQKIGKFKFEPFVVSVDSYPWFLTISQGDSVIYKSNSSRKFVGSPGFGPSNWANTHCNSQVSLSFPMTSFFFTTTSGFTVLDHLKNAHTYQFPNVTLFGQSSFFEISGSHVHILPACLKDDCSSWVIYANVDNEWIIFYRSDRPLRSPIKSSRVRSADLDFDGLPDLILPPLVDGGAYLLQRDYHCDDCFKTPTEQFFTFQIMLIDYLQVITPFYYHASSAFLYVSGTKIFISDPISTNNQAFFLLSIRLGGTSLPSTPVRLFYHTFDSPGYSTSYTLLPSFSHQALCFPFLVFGLGINPKYVPRVDVAHIFNESLRMVTWKSLIPNSHVYVSVSRYGKWKFQIFITLGKSLVYTGVTLGVLFVILMSFSLFLKWREIVEDGWEQYSEAKRSIMTSSSW